MSQDFDRTKVKNIVIHHLGDGKGPAETFAELFERSNTGGYEYPSYDFGVLSDGTVVAMRPLTAIGAHSQADRPQYMLGSNWWNKNSAGIVLGIDSTIYEPPAAMVEGLIDFLVDFCKARGASAGNCYPHFEILRTACPGASYAKLGFNTGFLNYNYVEDQIIRRMKGDLGVMDKPAVIVFGIWDLLAAYRLALKLNAPVIPRQAPWKTMGFNKFYIVGGPEEEGAGIVNLTGDDWESTTAEVLEALK